MDIHDTQLKFILSIGYSEFEFFEYFLVSSESLPPIYSAFQMR